MDLTKLIGDEEPFTTDGLIEARKLMQRCKCSHNHPGDSFISEFDFVAILYYYIGISRIINHDSAHQLIIEPIAKKLPNKKYEELFSSALKQVDDISLEKYMSSYKINGSNVNRFDGLIFLEYLKERSKFNEIARDLYRCYSFHGPKPLNEEEQHER